MLQPNLEYVVLQLVLPGQLPRDVGVLLLDHSTNRLHWRLRADWHELAPPEDAQVLSLLSQSLTSAAQEAGGEEFLKILEDDLSNILRLTERTPMESRDPQAAVHEVFRRRCIE